LEDLPNLSLTALSAGLAVYKAVETMTDETAVIAQKNCIGAYAPAQPTRCDHYTALAAQ
jgi:hypothetical protein